MSLVLLELENRNVLLFYSTFFFTCFNSFLKKLAAALFMRFVKPPFLVADFVFHEVEGFLTACFVFYILFLSVRHNPSTTIAAQG